MSHIYSNGLQSCGDGAAIRVHRQKVTETGKMASMVKYHAQHVETLPCITITM